MSTQPFSLPGAPSTSLATAVLQRVYPKLTAINIQQLQPILDQMCSWIFQLATQVGSPTTQVTSGTTTITGLHTDRLNRFPATAQNIGDRFIETDRGEVEYAVGSVGTVKAWIFLGGGAYGNTLANQPTDLGPNDAGFVFFATDTTDLYRWSGSAWIYFGGAKAAQDFDPVTDGGASLGSTVLRWLNLFVKSGVNIGGASAPRYLAEILGTGAAPLHISDHDADDGTWILSLHGVGTYFLSGASYNGANFVAKETAATLLVLADGGGIQVFHDSSLTPGFTYTPTLRLAVDGTGKLTTYAGSATLANGTMLIPAVTSAGSIVFVNGVAQSFVSPVGN